MISLGGYEEFSSRMKYLLKILSSGQATDHFRIIYEWCPYLLIQGIFLKAPNIIMVATPYQEKAELT